MSRGLDPAELKKLLKKGCNKKKKCLCVKIAQGGSWYCPECFNIIITMTHLKKYKLHDVILMDRKELKEEYLMMYLSGMFPERLI